MKNTLGIILIFAAFTLTSCTDEEFYEKDFVETIDDINNPDPGDGGNNGCTINCDDDDDDDNSEPNVTLIDSQDTFTQQEGNNKVDILWVIDNSGSMSNEQAAIAQNFDFFIQDFITKNVDFKMAITTTDNRPVQASLTALTSQKLQDDQAQFIADFKNMIKVGIHGSGREQGLKASEEFTLDYANNFFRTDAYYIVVYVSDEKDQSNKTPEQYLQTLRQWKDSSSLVRAYSIVNMNLNPQSGITPGYERYKYMADETNGYTKDITEDFYETLLTMGENIVELSLSFVLNETPYSADTIKVSVNGVEQSSGWTYDSSSNAIKFDEVSAPSAGSSITVDYKIEE